MKDRALGLLAVRWRSREELRRRLLQAGYEPEEIAPALDDLERAGLIDDIRFARELVRDQAARRLAGDRAIRTALWKKGVEQELIDVAVAESPDQQDRADQLARRRVARLAGLSPEAVYRRLYGLLLRRGYPPDLARAAARRAVGEASPSAGIGDPGEGDG